MIARLVLPVLGLAVVACGSGQAVLPAARVAPPPSLQVRAESLATSVPIDGGVAARRRAEIATRLMARVTAVPVDVGTPVRAGQVLVRLCV